MFAQPFRKLLSCRDVYIRRGETDWMWSLMWIKYNIKMFIEANIKHYNKKKERNNCCDKGAHRPASVYLEGWSLALTPRQVSVWCASRVMCVLCTFKAKVYSVLPKVNIALARSPGLRGIENLFWSVPSKRIVSTVLDLSFDKPWSPQQALRSAYWSCRCLLYVETVPNLTSKGALLLNCFVNYKQTVQWVNLSC